MRELDIVTTDGRHLEVLVDGVNGDVPLVFHVGTPAAAVPFPQLIEQTRGCGFRVVMYSRPGYGASTPQPGRQVSAAAADTAAILDHLGAQDFVTIGWSGGGPHALACAALLPARCRAVATVGGVAPHGEGFDWSAGMGQMNLDAFILAVEGGARYEQSLWSQAEILQTAQPEELAVHFASLLSSPDVQALTGPVADFLARSFRRSVAHGIAGWYDDEMAFIRHPWGFDLDDVAVPVAIWQGQLDLMTPPAHAKWLRDRLPQADMHLIDAEGHVSLMAQHLAAIINSVAAPS